MKKKLLAFKMKNIVNWLFFSFLFSGSSLFAGTQIYPAHWWTGMKWNKLQLMIYGDNVGMNNSVQINYPGITVQKVNKVENKNYLFVDISISPSARAGQFKIVLQGGKSSPAIFDYELKAHRAGNGSRYAQGVTSSDLIYLLMPDRFSNGDPSNDKIPGMRDQSLNRNEMYARHGGDFQGIINHLNYLQDLGVTALWMTPVIENDMPDRTEHGYAFTNHYKIEPRFGGAEGYEKLSDELHKRGMKLIQDAVYNHVGIHHFTVKDPPMKDWLHQWPSFTNPNYKDQTLFDPYAALIDKKQEADGWFTEQMPDLNQSNPYVANFLIQHAIWSVEEFGVDGWRIDTYIYCDLDFMNRCNKALNDEYPRMTMFGEIWVNGTVNQAFFTQNNINTSFKSNLPGAVDFQCLFDGIQPALLNPADQGFKLYQTLSNDIVYKNPMNNLVFLDNHDMTRIYSEVKENVDKLKIAISWLLTERGIPQIYYGTEVLMKGIKDPDGLVRSDFPGGWPNDKTNAFTGEGLSAEQKDVMEYTKKLANFRKQSSAIKTGKLMQYVPADGVYVYFRYDNKQTVMCIMNTGEKDKEINAARFVERLGGFSKAKNVIDNSVVDVRGRIRAPAGALLVLELVHSP